MNRNASQVIIAAITAKSVPVKNNFPDFLLNAIPTSDSVNPSVNLANIKTNNKFSRQ